MMYRVGRGCASEEDPVRWMVACVHPDKTVSARNDTLNVCVLWTNSLSSKRQLQKSG